MWYWRQENFEGLTALAAQATERGYIGFAEYCALREKGLRRKAFDSLNGFISTANRQSAICRREFVDWLSRFCFYNPNVADACPVPLTKQVIYPTVEEWIAAEPDNPVALRWSRDEEVILQAARMAPNDEISVGLCAMRMVRRIDFACHELPYGYLGESAREDLADVQTVIDLLHNVPNAQYFHPLREEALSLKMALQKHLANE